MSFESLVTRMAGAVAERDLQQLLELCHEEAELVSVMTPAEGGQPYRGHDGISAWWANTFETWDDYRLEPLGLLELDAAFGLVRWHLGGRGKVSGARVDTEIFAGVEVRQGLVRWFFTGFDRPTVLRALADRLDDAAG